MTREQSVVRTLLLIVVAFLAIPFLLMLFMLPLMGMGMGMWYWGGTRGPVWPWLLFGVFCLLVIVGVLYLLYRVILEIQPDDSNPALKELRQAYARGDLTDEEFKERRDRLRRDR